MKFSNPFRAFGVWMLFRTRSYILPLALVLLSVNLFYSFFIVGQKVDPNTSHIVKTINRLDAQIQPTAESWINSTDDSLYLQELWTNGLSGKLETEGAAIALFRDSTMVYWTQYPFTTQDNDLWKINGNSLQVIGNHQVLTKRYHSGNKTAVVILILFDQATNRYNPAIFHEQQINLLSAENSIRASLLHADTIATDNYQFFVEAKPRTNMPWPAELCGWLAISLLSISVKNLARKRTTRHNAFGFATILLLIFTAWRIIIFYTGIPNPNGIIFERVYGQHNLILGSLGDLLVSFSLILIYSTYLYQVRFKLRWRYQQFTRTQKVIAAGIITFLSALMVSIFHYALIRSIITPRINIQLYDIFDLSYMSAMFYLLAVIFFSVRILITQFTMTVFSKKSVIYRTIAAAIFILLILIPFSNQVRHTEYALVFFYVLFNALDYIRFKYKNYGAFLISLVVFSAYITFFATRQNSLSQNESMRTQAMRLSTRPRDQILAKQEQEESTGLALSNDRYRNFTYSRINPDNTITFQYNNNNDYQALLPQIEYGRDTLITMNGRVHFVFHNLSQDSVLLISRKEVTFLDAASLFVYIFLILFILSGLLLETSGYTFNVQRLTSRMSFRIRTVVIGVVIFAMGAVTLVIVTHTLNNFRNERRQFINNNIQRLSNTLTEYLAVNPADREHFQYWIREQIRNEDIMVNIYDPEGDLITTTNENFEETPRMGNWAFGRLHYQKVPFFVNDHDMNAYISAYMPIVQDKDKTVGYLNMRYSSPRNSSGHLQQELMADILNLFLIVLFIAIILSEILSRFLTKPFNKLHEAMGNISQMKKIDAVKTSRKISDEIGMLVIQYNQMIDYLEESYRQLARSEREEAWRDMARQVAHEIKNPLTPMRLKIQMLQRAMKREDCHDLKPQVESTLQLVLEQTELLNNIATEFSDFAKMGEGSPKRIDLVPLVCNVAKLYSGYENIGVRLHYDCGCTPHDLGRETDLSFMPDASSVPIPVINNNKPIWVTADPDHLTRVFVNICLNAVQALSNQKAGWIDIAIEIIGRRVLISFRDNGPGIPPEVQQRIFTPNFTTKSSGSGLGLAMSRKIVEMLGGTIDFESKYGTRTHGTVFIVNLPLHRSQK